MVFTLSIVDLIALAILLPLIMIAVVGAVLAGRSRRRFHGGTDANFLED